VIKLISIFISITLIFTPIAFAENYKKIKENNKEYYLVPPKHLQGLYKEMKLGDKYKLKIDQLEKLNDSNVKIITNYQLLTKDQELTDSLLNQQKLINDAHIQQLEGLYKSEVKENEKLRLEQPCIMCWTIGGVVIGISVTALAVSLAKNL